MNSIRNQRAAETSPFMVVKVNCGATPQTTKEVNMKFDEIYKNPTLLTDDWLKNECDYELNELQPSQRQSIYRQYYLNMCSAINALLYLKLSNTEIEELLENPIYNSKCCCRLCTNSLSTNVQNPDERRYLFLMAQYDQLSFDIANGRTAMLRGEDKRWIIAPDALGKLDMLGFCQRTYAVKW